MGLGASAPAGDPMADGGTPMGNPGMGGGGAPMGGPPQMNQMNKKDGKMPSFGKKMAPGAKPAFGAHAVLGKDNPSATRTPRPSPRAALRPVSR